MPVKPALFLAGLILIPACGYCYSLAETENRVWFLEGYLRNDAVTLKNTVDLDSANSDDTTTYLGIDYSFALRSKSKENGPEFFLKLERNGPTDYDAPLFAHNTLMTSGGVIEEYRNDELLPQAEEFWLDTPLWQGARFKSGLYAYEVGNGFALNGAYENYGVTLYRQAKNLDWRFYYCRPEAALKNHLGPRIRQDQEQGVQYSHSVANFFAADVKFSEGKNYLWLYGGVLADYTSSGKRDNIFSTPVKKDLLGTFGIATDLSLRKMLFKFEAARNFGRAKSTDSAFKDVSHRGWLVYSGVDYDLGRATPSFNVLVCSGNKVTPDMALNQDATLTSGKNRAFSYFSPFNKNLDDAVSSCHADIRPVVAMGAGCGLNYGIPRPRTFAVSDFENLIMPSPRISFKLSEKIKLDLDGYYLMSFEKGAGTLNGEGKYLSRELGSEADLLIEYQLNKNTVISFLGGYFLPGEYFKEERDDAAGSLLSSYVRGDGRADCAYQVELSAELKF